VDKARVTEKEKLRALIPSFSFTGEWNKINKKSQESKNIL
jgi:hypothetical protein